jgi:hypothetical protein
VLQLRDIETGAAKDRLSTLEMGYVADLLARLEKREGSAFREVFPAGLPPISDSENFRRELARFPRVWKLFESHPERYDVYDLYFKVHVYYQKHKHHAPPKQEIVLATGASREQVDRWCFRGMKPIFLLRLERERALSAARFALEDRLQQEFNHFEISNNTPPTLRAIEDSELRRRIIPSPNAPLIREDVVEKLLSLVKNNQCLRELLEWYKQEGSFLIADYETYLKALQAFPLVQNHPQLSRVPGFDELHHQVKCYFLIQSICHSDRQLPQKTLAELVGLEKHLIESWFGPKEQRPRLLTMLEHRVKTKGVLQQHLTTIREQLNGIYTVNDIAQRIDTTAIAHHIRNNTKYEVWREAAQYYLQRLNLVEAGHHPIDLGEYFERTRHHDLKYYFERTLNPPYLVRVASSIPENPPEPSLRWLPIEGEGTGKTWQPTNWIQVPTQITTHDELSRVLEQLPTPNLERLQNTGITLETFQAWEARFGFVQTLEERQLAVLYLVGATLSDGTISAPGAAGKPTLSSNFSIDLSIKYEWSQDFGDRVAYYWTALGIPTKQGENQPSKGDRYPRFRWASVHSPFLVWFNERVLGLPPGGTHTDYCAKADWLLEAKRDLQIRCIQGLFDGDGWASTRNLQVGVAAIKQADFVEPLLHQVGLHPIRTSKNILVFDSLSQIQRAAELPVFFSATEKQMNIEKIVRMKTATRAITKGSLEFLPHVRQIQDLKRNHPYLTANQIREVMFDRIGITYGSQTIERIISGGADRLKVDRRLVTAYFKVLEVGLQKATAQERRARIRKVVEETGVQRSIRTLMKWMTGLSVPIDVRRALSEPEKYSEIGAASKGRILEHYPHLLLFMPFSSCLPNKPSS